MIKISEARVPKSETIPKLKCSKLVSNFGHLIFKFVSSFDIRISDLSIFVESYRKKLYQQAY